MEMLLLFLQPRHHSSGNKCFLRVLEILMIISNCKNLAFDILIQLKAVQKFM